MIRRVLVGGFIFYIVCMYFIFIHIYFNAKASQSYTALAPSARVKATPFLKWTLHVSVSRSTSTGTGTCTMYKVGR